MSNKKTELPQYLVTVYTAFAYSQFRNNNYKQIYFTKGDNSRDGEDKVVVRDKLSDSIINECVLPTMPVSRFDFSGVELLWK